MRGIIRLFAVLVLVFGLVFVADIIAPTGLAVAGGPTDSIKDATERAVGILNADNMSPAEKRRLFRELMHEKINFEETSRMTLGPNWPRDPAKQREFVGLFAELILHTYVSNLGKADVSFQYGKEYQPNKSDFSRYVVQTVMKTKKGDVSIDYAMMFVDGKWKIYNILVEHISLVSNWKSQFQRIIANRSFDGLLSVLRDKNAKFNEDHP